MVKRSSAAKPTPAPAPMLKLDFGCGKNKREGFQGVDRIAFDGVDYVFDIGCEPWPFADNSVESAHASHFIEHLTQEERVHFFNELWRVMVAHVPQTEVGKLTFAVPHFASARAYGDPTHKWPAFSEWALLYLNREWRKVNAPHTDAEHNPLGFRCDFDWSYGYSMRGDLLTRNAEYQQFALANHKEAAQDLVGAITVRK